MPLSTFGKPIFVRISNQKTHERFMSLAELITKAHPEKIYFDEIDCVIWQNGHEYGFKKELKDFIIDNKDKIELILTDYDNVVSEYNSIKTALDTIFDLDVWETYR